MNDHKIDCFPFYILGAKSPSEEEAWDSFKREAERQFKWINGVKTWRCIPSLYVVRDFDDDEDYYVVKARAVSFEVLPKEMKKAEIEGPYEENGCPLGDAVGFAF